MTKKDIAVPAGKAKPSWRDMLPVHPAAEMIPPATVEEQRVLRGDLKQHGQREPVVLVRIGQGCVQLLDGRTRLDLQEANGDAVVGADGDGFGGNLIVPHRTVELADDAAAVSFVMSLNVHRRHLDREEKRKLIGKLLKASPERSDRQIAKEVKVHNETVASVRKKMEARDGIRHVSKRTDSKGRQQPAAKPATSAAKAITNRAEITAPARETATQARQDVGPTSSGELQRKLARLDELENLNRVQASQIIGLTSEGEDLRAQVAAGRPQDLQAAIETLIKAASCTHKLETELPKDAVFEKMDLDRVVGCLKSLNKFMVKRRRKAKRHWASPPTTPRRKTTALAGGTAAEKEVH